MSGLQSHIDLSDKEFKAISEMIYTYCGINLESNKKEMVRSRLSKFVRKYNFSSYSDYFEFVTRDPKSAEFTEMIDRISTNMTSFFREQHHFDFLAEKLIPQIIKSQPNPSLLKVRAWSAGCSTGEEPYSIAITLSEKLPEKAVQSVRILASDISTNVLGFAKRGVYPIDRVSTIQKADLNRYFNISLDDGEKAFSVKPALRKMILFKQINLMGAWPISTKLDFIFCRNVMIYFDKPTQQKLISRYEDLLKPGGILFIGHSESLANVKHNLKYVEPTIYQKT